MYWRSPSVELHSHWEGNVKQNAALDPAEVETFYRGRSGSSCRETAFLRAKRLRSQIMFILCSGLHPPLNLISYSVRTNGRALSEQRWFAKWSNMLFQFLNIGKKIIFLYLIFSEQLLPIAHKQFLFLLPGFWIKKYMFRYIKNHEKILMSASLIFKFAGRVKIFFDASLLHTCMLAVFSSRHEAMVSF